MSPGLQCEWAKSKAHAARWAKEVQLLVEEMRWVITFLDWKAHWWIKQGNARSGQLAADIADGVSAYAAKQAHVFSALAGSFAAKWYPVLLANGLPVEWLRSHQPTTSVLAPDYDSDMEYE
jgi:hypothetical protein